jgi:predicted protein tyrosine phosphatase
MRITSHLGQLNLGAQGDFPRILFVCSGGMLRSATASHVFASEPYNWNTRAAGTMSGAIVPVTETLLEWADKIFVMQEHHALEIKERFGGFGSEKVSVLEVPDRFFYRDPELVRILISKVTPHIEVDDEPTTPNEQGNA